MIVSVLIEEAYMNGDFAQANEGVYEIEARAWGDNNFDTGAFELLQIQVINPCLSKVIAPASPLPQQTYYIGELNSVYEIETIADPEFFYHPVVKCGPLAFKAELFLFTDRIAEGPLDFDQPDSFIQFDGENVSFSIETSDL